MYCQKCGYKIKGNADHCENCGAEVFVEYCGGFWDLLDEPQAAADTLVVTAPAIDEEAEAEKDKTRENSKPAKKKMSIWTRILLYILGILCVLLALSTLVQTLRMNNAVKTYEYRMQQKEAELDAGHQALDKVTAEKAILEESFQQMEAEKEELKQANELLQKDKEELEKQIEEIEKYLKDQVKAEEEEKVEEEKEEQTSTGGESGSIFDRFLQFLQSGNKGKTNQQVENLNSEGAKNEQ